MAFPKADWRRWLRLCVTHASSTELRCQRFLPHHMDAFDAAVERSMSRTAVVRITLTEPPVGKRKQYDANGDEMKYGRSSEANAGG